MVIPIVMVVGYSLMDNVIMEQNPQFAGFTDYIDILTSETSAGPPAGSPRASPVDLCEPGPVADAPNTYD
ncbi:hypothetical protein [Tessaracoccus sp. G1721]